MKISGQEWYNDLWVKAADTQVVGAVTRFPVSQQCLRQSDSVIVFLARGLLPGAVRTVPIVDAVLGTGKNGTGSHEVRLVEPVAPCEFRCKVAQEEGDEECTVERKSLGPRSAAETKRRRCSITHLSTPNEAFHWVILPSLTRLPNSPNLSSNEGA